MKDPASGQNLRLGRWLDQPQWRPSFSYSAEYLRGIAVFQLWSFTSE